MIEVNNLHCHACNQYMKVELDTELDGNHQFNCPKCGHTHYRVILNGKITGQRWRSSGPVYTVQAYYSPYASTNSTGTATSIYLSQSWANTTAGTR